MRLVAYRGNNHSATYSTVVKSGAFIFDLEHREGKEHTDDSSTDATISW